MKKFKYLFAFLAIGLASCETDTGDESFMDNRDTIVSLTSGSATIFTTAEGENTFTLSVAVSQRSTSPMEIALEVDSTSDAVLGTDFTMSANSITIPAGAFSGSIDIVTDFDAASFDGKTLIVKMMSVDGAVLGQTTKCTIDIVKSCPLPEALNASYTANPFAFGVDAPEFTASFTRIGTEGLTYSLDSGWGPNFVSFATGNSGYDGLYVYPCELTVNADGTVDVTGSGYVSGGSGTFDACTGIITVTLRQALFTTDFTVDVTFTP
jgi:hypothetical protein